MNPPKKITFWVSAALGLLGFIGQIVTVPVLSPLAFWLVLIGLVLMLLGNTVKGL
jgi:hypothetical protein